MITAIQIEKIRKNFDGTEQRAIFKILADTNRYRIFKMLYKFPDLTVSDIAKVLKISLPLCSQHLKILEQAALLEKQKLGQKVYFKHRADNKLAQAIAKRII